MSDEYNCGKHDKRVQPHWHGKRWCNGRPNQGGAK